MSSRTRCPSTWSPYTVSLSAPGAAGHVEHLPGDEPRRLAGEERHRVGHVLRQTRPGHRNTGPGSGRPGRAAPPPGRDVARGCRPCRRPGVPGRSCTPSTWDRASRTVLEHGLHVPAGGQQRTAGLRGEVHAAEGHRPGLRPRRLQDRPDQCGLPGAGLPHHTKGLPLAHVQRHPGHGVHHAGAHAVATHLELLHHVPDFQQLLPSGPGAGSGRPSGGRSRAGAVRGARPGSGPRRGRSGARTHSRHGRPPAPAAGRGPRGTASAARGQRRDGLQQDLGVRHPHVGEQLGGRRARSCAGRRRRAVATTRTGFGSVPCTRRAGRRPPARPQRCPSGRSGRPR